MLPLYLVDFYYYNIAGGAGVGDDGIGDGVDDGGVGDGVGLGVGLGVGDGFGIGEGVGDGVGIGVVAGFGVGTVSLAAYVLFKTFSLTVVPLLAIAYSKAQVAINAAAITFIFFITFFV